ncbi:thiamine biosynthesis lipoprotein [Jannaschia faecimaris]|uniref:FAD:protein FMN transferase n=1 Tax=Jannaschia faecimaris TaxID=1244108 RepID=A0A1H3S9W3_9RHOB|nr:FAD:protein FMN transferase [Jannaschia faecimaris]SDZ34782.1 thiamine biosynthesis lipoprotein [Jannaschia faecimaris]
MTITRRNFTTLCGTAAVCALSGASRAASPPSIAVLNDQAFGTTWQVLVPATADLFAIRSDIDAVLTLVDNQMSPWRHDSDISRFNRAAAGRHTLPPETLKVTRAALDIARQSDGAFDPTVGPLVARWGFGPIKGDSKPDWSALTLSQTALEKARTGLTLDLCGIAKGRALDLIADRLRSAGLTTFLIDIGGELLAAGRHPDGRRWRSGIEDPRQYVTELVGVLELQEFAVATSGTRWNSVQVGNRRLSHIITPSARHPVPEPLAQVSVIAPSAMMADGWATALMAAGEEKGVELARSHGIAALFLIPAGGALRRIATGEFDDHVLS